MKALKVLETIRKVLKSVQKSPPTENQHHAETSKPTLNANQPARCNTTRAQNQKGFKNRSGYQ